MGYHSYQEEYRDVDVEDLLGKVVTVIEQGDDVLTFYTEDGDVYRMIHHQDCCESVEIEDIIGDLDDLIGSPILMAEEVSQEGEGEGDADDDWGSDSSTWTFYKFATIRGYVTIRWYGYSNGYYSESVDFEVKRGAGNVQH